MSRFNTGNPIGSGDVKDLSDNAKNLDVAENSVTELTWRDRFGRNRKTMHGMEVDSANAIYEFKQEGDLAVSDFESSGAQVIQETKDQADRVIANLGFFVPIPYAPGIYVEEPNVTVTYEGVTYAAQSGQVPFTTDEWDSSQWYPIQNEYNDNKLLIFQTLSEAENSANTLPDGQVVVIGVDKYVVSSGALTGKSAAVKTAYGDALSNAVPWVTPFAFGAKADGVFDDGSAIADAKALGLVLMPKGDYRDTGNGQFYVYTNELKSKGGAVRYAWGSQSEPITDFRPVKMVEKFSSVSRDAVGSNGWDVGGIYSVVHKIGGDAFIAGITSQTRSVSGQGECIALHGRSGGTQPNVSEIFGMWAYADINPSDGTKIYQAIGLEINLRNQGAAPSLNPSLDAIPTGNYRGLIVNTADGSKPCHVGVDVGTQVSNGSLGWYRAIQVRQNGVYPTASAGFDTFAIGIEGGSTGANRYGGIRLGRGSYSYGLSMLDVDGSISNNAAIALKHGHKIQWGSLTTSSYVTVDAAEPALLNLNGLSLAVAGVKVVGQQRPAIPNAVAGSEITTLNLVLSAMRNHGLIAI